MEAEAGKSVVLPCITEPQWNLEMVHWTRKENVGHFQDDQDVHLYRHNKDDLQAQNQDFKNRTSLFNSELSKGNCSLKLSNVNKSHSGTYECAVRLPNSENEKTYCLMTLCGKYTITSILTVSPIMPIEKIKLMFFFIFSSVVTSRQSNCSQTDTQAQDIKCESKKKNHKALRVTLTPANKRSSSALPLFFVTSHCSSSHEPPSISSKGIR